MTYEKPEIKFQKFYTESFLVDEDVVSSNESAGNIEIGHQTGGRSYSPGGVDGWMNG